MPPRKQPLSKRIILAIQNELYRIREQNRRTRTGIKKPSFSQRLRHSFKLFKKDLLVKKKPIHKPVHRSSYIKRLRYQYEDYKNTKKKMKGLSSSANPELFSLSTRFRYYIKEQRELYSVVFSRDYMVILLNSVALFLLSFFLVYFVTLMLTGAAAYVTEISTLLNYSVVDYKIHSYDWTFLQVVTVFSVPSLVLLVIILIIAQVFESKKEEANPIKWYQMITRKQREKAFAKPDLVVLEKKKKSKRGRGNRKRRELNWYTKLFFLWTLYHCITYFFSGMLFSLVFYRRSGYVIWHVFAYNTINYFFAGVAFLFLVILGFVYASQFMVSARMYFNQLVDRNRMPFIYAQAILPFYIGMIITTLMMIPDISYTLIFMNFSMIFLLFPLQIRGNHYPEIQFDSEPKEITVKWDWVFMSLVIMVAIYLPLKIGIFISL